MGILNNKERVLDTILTQEGKKQIAGSSLKATYYSFTDMGALYLMDTVVSGGAQTPSGLEFNETYRNCFEASNLPQDTIVYETDDSGKLKTAIVPTLSGASVLAGNIFVISSSISTEVTDFTTFASLANGVVSASIDSFKNQMLLSSPDPLDERERLFVLGPTETTMVITDDRPISNKNFQEGDIDHIESFFFDKRLSHIPNFQFLPPINHKKFTNDETVQIGNYANIKQEPILNFNDIKSELSKLDSMGFKQTVNFVETSNENNLVCQFFEFDNTTLGKLDVIDFGSFEVEDGTTKHVFFCGKVFIDNNGLNTYVNMFTLVFDSNV